MGENTAHEALVERIYDAIVDERAYRDLPEEIAASVDAISTWLMIAEGDHPVVDGAYNLDPAIFADYETYYHGCDLWWESRHRMAFDTAIAFERLVPTRTFTHSEFYNDFVRLNGDRMHGLGAMTDIGGRVFAIGLHRSRRGDVFETADERRLQALLPHLNRMMRSRTALERATEQLQLGEYAFQQNGDARFLCDGRGRVLHCNRAARRLPTELLAIGRDRRIRMAAPMLATRLSRALRGAIDRRVAATLLAPRRDRLPWRITVDPTDRDEPAAIVTVIDADRALLTRLERASLLYHFTPSELALAESLMRGRSIEQHASLRGTRVSTVRAQLRALLAKSHTPRQTALVAALQRC